MLTGKLAPCSAFIGGLMCMLVVCGLAGPVSAQVWPMPEVLLEVHPNERGVGSSNNYIGSLPWIQTTIADNPTYWAQKWVFAAGDPVDPTAVTLWIQVCAQNWNWVQKGYANGNDLTKMEINGVVPPDYDGIATGVAWQWRGKKDKGDRLTLRFLVPAASGKQLLRIGMDESPVIWWIKVTDLEDQVVYPEEPL